VAVLFATAPDILIPGAILVDSTGSLLPSDAAGWNLTPVLQRLLRVPVSRRQEPQIRSQPPEPVTSVRHAFPRSAATGQPSTHGEPLPRRARCSAGSVLAHLPAPRSQARTQSHSVRPWPLQPSCPPVADTATFLPVRLPAQPSACCLRAACSAPGRCTSRTGSVASARAFQPRRISPVNSSLHQPALSQPPSPPRCHCHCHRHRHRHRLSARRHSRPAQSPSAPPTAAPSTPPKAERTPSRRAVPPPPPAAPQRTAPLSNPKLASLLLCSRNGYLYPVFWYVLLRAPNARFSFSSCRSRLCLMGLPTVAVRIPHLCPTSFRIARRVCVGSVLDMLLLVIIHSLSAYPSTPPPPPPTRQCLLAVSPTPPFALRSCGCPPLPRRPSSSPSPAFLCCRSPPEPWNGVSFCSALPAAASGPSGHVVRRAI